MTPLHDSAGRELEAGNQIWITTQRFDPYTAFQKRPDDDPDVDVHSLIAHEDG
ncbi:MAG: hypothetical protein WAN74_07785 [Thermoplasmata archaeon]